MESAPDVAHQIDEIRRHFAATLPGRVRRIADLWSSLDNEWESTTLSSLYAEVHRLSGCCGTLGVHRIGDVARQIQATLSEVMEARVPPCHETKRQVGAWIGAMENLAGPEPDPCRVLVVEDDMDLASVYSAILREAGMQVLVTDPASAGDRAQDFHPDLVLLDLTTPTCRRFELAGTIRKHQFLSSVPLICLTCEEEPATVRQEAPAADWLQKPYDPEKLIALIRERIDAAHARA